jgi:hypothetical protein
VLLGFSIFMRRVISISFSFFFVVDLWIYKFVVDSTAMTASATGHYLREDSVYAGS